MNHLFLEANGMDLEVTPSVHQAYDEKNLLHSSHLNRQEFVSKNEEKFWTLNRLAKKIAKERYPLIALYQIWENSVTKLESINQVQSQAISPLDYLNNREGCLSEEYEKQFICLCHLLGIDTRQVSTQGVHVYDFCLKDDNWTYIDLSQGLFYLGWDNETLISSENMMDDPLLVLRSKTQRESSFSFVETWRALAGLKIINCPIEEGSLDFRSEKDTLLRNVNRLKLSFNKNEIKKKLNNQVSPSITILNQSEEFEYISPVFHFTSNTDTDCQAELIHWQISLDKNFKVIPFNLEEIKPFESTLCLSLLDETFLNSQDTYYLRVKGYRDQEWSEWGTPFAFSVKKPQPVSLVEFDQISNETFQLDWGREAETTDGSIEYLIFGSNAFDFIPSIYSSIQINKMTDGKVNAEETNDNLITITTDTKILIDGRLAYYRIVARKQGQLSIPSPIIHVYGPDLVQPRTVLQLVEDNHRLVAKRVLFPATYPWTQTALPRLGLTSRLYESSLLELQTYIANVIEAGDPNNHTGKGYSRPSHVSRELWDRMKPYFLPENHPWKNKIDRIFSQSRASQNYDTLRKAGFKGRITHVRKIFAGTHPECVECFFKIYCDSEVNMRYTEWQKWLDRIRGKNNVKEVIKKHGFEKWFSTPEKWCYPLPEKPSAPRSSTHYRPKDFILVCSNQRPYDHIDNEKMWKSKITYQILDALYIVLDEAGMWDSMFIFNIPFSKIDGKICFVDTEYSHKWPLRFDKLSKYLSSTNRKYWENLIKNHGPKGYKRPIHH